MLSDILFCEPKPRTATKDRTYRHPQSVSDNNQPRYKMAVEKSGRHQTIQRTHNIFALYDMSVDRRRGNILMTQ